MTSKILYIPSFCVLLLTTFCPLLANAQIKYPVVGTYLKKSAQGFAIYDNYAYLMSDGGRVRQLNLITKTIEKDFLLSCAQENPHVNNACFGVEKYQNSTIPVIYITECRRDKFRCFVESLNDGDPCLIQTIQAKKNNKVSRVYVWVVDPSEKMLYAITRNEKAVDSIGNKWNTITKYKLPTLKQGSIVYLNEEDVIDSFDVLFPNVLQGCKIKGKYMYLVTGLHQSQSHRSESKRSIKVLDLKKKKMVKEIDLTYITMNEPEDIDFYHKSCLLYCGQEGGVYKVKLK